MDVTHGHLHEGLTAEIFSQLLQALVWSLAQVGAGGRRGSSGKRGVGSRGELGLETGPSHGRVSPGPPAGKGPMADGLRSEPRPERGPKRTEP